MRSRSWRVWISTWALVSWSHQNKPRRGPKKREQVNRSAAATRRCSGIVGDQLQASGTPTVTRRCFVFQIVSAVQRHRQMVTADADGSPAKSADFTLTPL